MKRCPAALLLLLGLTACLPPPARGAGPVLASNSDPPKAVIWRNPSTLVPSNAVPYNLDRGGLGTLTEAQADAMMTEILDNWTNVASSVVAFSNAGKLPVDVTAANQATYLGQGVDGLNPIVYDQDGSIHDALFGGGNSVLGFAGAVTFFTGTTARIFEAEAALNGRFLDGNVANGELTPENFKGVFFHEIGHYIGLDHSQMNRKEAFDGATGNDGAIPTMFPINVHQGSSTEGSSPHADDVASVSQLYPETNFSTTTGKITGTVFDSSGTSFQGMNIIARKVDDPLLTAVSTVSGYLYQAREDGTPSSSLGTTNTAFRGAYELCGLPPGDYTLEIESVDQRFKGGSSVGPVSPPEHGGVREFWNGFNEGTDPTLDRTSESVIIPVGAGQTVSGVNFHLNFAQGIYEDFNTPGANDLANSQLIFSPEPAAPGGYRVRRVTGISSFPIDPSTHTTLALSDNSFVTMNMPLGLSPVLYDTAYVAANLSSNGFLTFGSPVTAVETDASESLEEHMGPRPRVSMLYDDLDPGAGGTVKRAFFTTGLAVTFENVPLSGSPGATSSFQCFVGTDGTVTLTYLSVAGAARGIVGISSGGAFSAGFAVSRDYSSLANDTTAPSVSITSPADGASVSGVVGITTSVSDSGASSGLNRVDFYLDGILLGSDSTAPFSQNWDTTTYANGPRRLEAVAVDNSGNVGRAAVVAVVNNGGAALFSQSITNASRTGSLATFTLNIRNDSAGTAADVTLNRFWFEGTGAFAGVRQMFAGPTSGAPLPRNLGSLAPGATASIELRVFVPADVTAFRRWVDTGTAVVGGQSRTF